MTTLPDPIPELDGAGIAAALTRIFEAAAARGFQPSIMSVYFGREVNLILRPRPTPVDAEALFTALDAPTPIVRHHDNDEPSTRYVGPVPALGVAVLSIVVNP